MALKPSSADARTRSWIQIFIVFGLCCFFCILGAWQRSGFGKGDSIALEMTKHSADCNIVWNLNFETHHFGEVGNVDESEKPKSFEPCHPPRISSGTVPGCGLIGIYHDWCEAFSTYPRTYDLIHANGLFRLYQDKSSYIRSDVRKCNLEDILLKMDRIMQPEGVVIFLDKVDVLIEVKKITAGMRWDTQMVDHEDGPLVPEMILVAVKQY
ncbi:putative methyltransferase PMT14 [Hibiscus syriacus]|uniref:Methyltransferase n=1 Tax=Hibiscus syriacus TaxID=106335 RepID=A0A6A2XXF1_HIBSY|nr:putative methyltransferase PMT14 [Hibiscus syriacus]